MYEPPCRARSRRPNFDARRPPTHQTQLAKGYNYLDVGDWNPSPGEHRHLGYSVDTTGYEVRACVSFISFCV